LNQQGNQIQLLQQQQINQAKLNLQLAHQAYEDASQTLALAVFRYNAVINTPYTKVIIRGNKSFAVQKNRNPTLIHLATQELALARQQKQSAKQRFRQAKASLQDAENAMIQYRAE